MAKQSRGLRNNNPGNIRLVGGVLYRGEVEGSDREFRTFAAPEWGYRAIFVLLHTYKVRYGICTIATAIARWAPPSENNTTAYIKSVAQLSGRAADEPYNTLSATDMKPIAAAIAQIENGTPADKVALDKGWEKYIEN